MNRSYLFGFVLAAFGTPLNDALKKDLDALQGEWELEQVEIEGKKVEGRGGTFTFRGKKVILGGTEAASLELDPTCNPKVIDFISSDSRITGLRTEGIYKLEGDTLTWCLNLGKGVKNRPTKFQTKEGVEHILVKLRRIKAREK